MATDRKQYMREYHARTRAQNLALGLTAHGTPRKKRRLAGPRKPRGQPKVKSPTDLAALRRDALEMLTWMATRKGVNHARLLGIQAHAANLPLSWWAHKGTHSIALIIENIQAEMERPCVIPER